MTRRLTALLSGVMLAQSLLGLLFADRYRDAEWIAATWWGNDWVTLMVAVPLLGVYLARPANGSPRVLLLRLGILAYGVYNYTYYVFGAALNVFFPLYLCAVLLSSIALIASLASLDVEHVAAHFRSATPVRTIGGYFIFVGVSLAAVWLTMWAAHVFAGRPTPVEPEAFKLVAALDVVLMVPALTVGGTWLWRRDPWGYVVACMAGVQASLYLLVLSINSIVFLYQGLADAPGELPIWGTLAIVTAGMTVVLLANATQSAEGDKNGSGIRFPRIVGKTDPGTLMLGRAVLIWLCIVPAAIINGLVRDLMLVPMLGDPVARAVSCLALAGAVLLIARASIRWIAPASRSDAWAVGLVWLGLTLAFEFVVGHFVFGAPWETLRADYNVFAGRLWVVVLAAALATPRLVYVPRNIS